MSITETDPGNEINFEAWTFQSPEPYIFLQLYGVYFVRSPMADEVI